MWLVLFPSWDSWRMPVWYNILQKFLKTNFETQMMLFIKSSYKEIKTLSKTNQDPKKRRVQILRRMEIPMTSQLWSHLTFKSYLFQWDMVKCVFNSPTEINGILKVFHFGQIKCKVSAVLAHNFDHTSDPTSKSHLSDFSAQQGSGLVLFQIRPDIITSIAKKQGSFRSVTK